MVILIAIVMRMNALIKCREAYSIGIKTHLNVKTVDCCYFDINRVLSSHWK